MIKVSVDLKTSTNLTWDINKRVTNLCFLIFIESYYCFVINDYFIQSHACICSTDYFVCVFLKQNDTALNKDIMLSFILVIYNDFWRRQLCRYLKERIWRAVVTKMQAENKFFLKFYFDTLKNQISPTYKLHVHQVYTRSIQYRCHI